MRFAHMRLQHRPQRDAQPRRRAELAPTPNCLAVAVVKPRTKSAIATPGCDADVEHHLLASVRGQKSAYPVTCNDGNQPDGIMVIHVSASALSHLRPALWLAGPARPVVGLQGCRAACAAT